MLTIFTTTKKFEGHNANSQINAINSWLDLSPEIEVLIFGNPEGLKPTEFDERVNVISYVECINDIPRIDYMFESASAKANNEICCFLNADIILTKDFFDTIKNLNLAGKKEYLIVGQRFDFENLNGRWDFEINWEKKYLSGPKTIHPPAGSDFFIFPKMQYSKKNIPDLIVGRPGWDLWMIYNARVRNFKTINLSSKCLVYHQNHDYSHKKNIYTDNLLEPESQHNLSFLPYEGKFLFTLKACNYYVNDDFSLKKINTGIDIYLVIRGHYFIFSHFIKLKIMLIRIKKKVKSNLKFL
jgi:hypothetical protein